MYYYFICWWLIGNPKHGNFEKNIKVLKRKINLILSKFFLKKSLEVQHIWVHKSCRIESIIKFYTFSWILTINFRELSAEALLDLDIFNLSATDKKKKVTDKRMDIDEEEDLDDSSPLFWQPGKRGFYSPRPGKNSPERLNAFRNVGRYVFPLCVSIHRKFSVF